MPKNIDNLNPIDYILIKGAALHNLKNIDMAIPRNKLIVITGLSGSGKSSLAFDTLYAEGQRRYVESLSSYARQFLGKLNKPKVDYIKGISPAIAIEQKVNSTNPRSTVGTSTEIYDYLKLLFARIGKTISPKSNQEVKKDKVTDVINFIKELEEGTKLLLLAPIQNIKEKKIDTYLNVLIQQGYSRLKMDEEVLRLKTPFTKEFIQQVEKSKALYIVVDRVVTQQNEDFYNRLADSVQTTFYEGHGLCVLQNLSDNNLKEFSNKFELDGLTFLEPNTHFFSFNNPYGACPKCEGYGSIIGIDTDLVIPNTSLSIYNDAIVPWRTDRFSEYKEALILASADFDIPIHKPYYKLTKEQKQLIWTGNKSFKGLNHFFEFLEKSSYKIQFRVMLSRYRGKTTCTECNGNRLRKETDYVKVGAKNISQLVQLPLDELL
ncbi:MAG TPA: excinuclease ABC subunit A, partial [Flavobacteriaceae bacterium]|nr:excinuclease ABC subunit A [Flavobacteriaceae bacterium]